MQDGTMMMSFLPLIIVSIPFAVGFGYLAQKLEKPVAVWVILSLIPIVNYFFWVYGFFVTVLFVIDLLRSIQASVAGRIEAPPTPTAPAA